MHLYRSRTAYPLVRIVLTVCVALFAASTHAASIDLDAAINRLRTGTGCGGGPLPPLMAKVELNRAAAAIARGRDLGRSVADAGYRAAHAKYIRVSGGSTEQQIGLLKRKYCSDLRATDIFDMGVYRGGRESVIVLAAPFNPRVPGSADAAARRLLALVNDARAQSRTCGSRRYAAAPPLRWNATLADVAREHAANMASGNFFSHVDRDGYSPGQRVARAGYRYRSTGENIAGGQETPEEAVQTWIDSPPHCANLMDPRFKEMGAAFGVDKRSSLGIYWVQVLGTPRT